MYVPTLAEIELLVETGDQELPAVAARSSAIAILYATGAEVQDVLGLAWSDRRPLDEDAIVLRFPETGGTHRDTPVLRAATKLLLRHERLSPPPTPSSPMFATLGRPLTARTLDRDFKKRATTIGLPGPLSLSVIRSARVRDLLDEGMAVDDVAALVGVANVNAILRWRSRIIDGSARSHRTGKR